MTSSSSAAAPAAARLRIGLAPVGQENPDPRARRLAAARSAQLERRGRFRRQSLCLAGYLADCRTATPFQPQVHYFVGGATKVFGAALYRLREGGFRRVAASTTACRRRGRSATTSWSLITPRPSISIRCMASTASTRPSRRRARLTRRRRSRTSRASQSCRRSRRRRLPSRFTRLPR